MSFVKISARAPEIRDHNKTIKHIHYSVPIQWDKAPPRGPKPHDCKKVMETAQI